MFWNAFRQGAAADPWRELHRLHHEMDRLFGEAHGPTAALEFPPIDLWSGENGLVMHARMPGVAASDIDLSVVGDTLTLKGERPDAEAGEKDSYHRRERESGRFVRTIQLPFPVEGDAVKAQFRSGILEVELPRAASDKPRKIAVKSA